MTTQRDTRLVELALGILDPEARRDLERELAGSPDAREELARLERSLVELALAEEPLRPSEDLRERIARALEPRTRLEGFARRVADFLDLGLERTREILARVADAASAPWEEDRVPGVRLLHFSGGPRLAAADCGLVHVAPGATYPRHLHRGDEWAFVLQGRGEEDTGRVWEPGDVIRNPAGSAHSFRAASDEPFVFVVVVHEGIRFTRD